VPEFLSYASHLFAKNGLRSISTARGLPSGKKNQVKQVKIFSFFRVKIYSKAVKIGL